MRSSLLVSGLALVLAGSLSLDASAQMTQTLPAGFLNVDGNSSTSFPQNTTADHKWQWHYDSTNFTQGMPIIITEVYVRASTPTATVNAFDFPSWTVTLIEASTDYQVGNHDPTFANNILRSAVVKTGAFQGGPIPPSGGTTATWIPMGLTGNFLYDPTTNNDFIVQIEKCGTNATWGASMDGASGSAGTNGGNRYGNTSSCTAAMSTFQNNEFVPIVKIDYMPASGLFPNFTANVTSGPSPLTVQFTDTSFSSDPAGITSWAWDLDGDGVVDSNAQNPMFIYQNCGDFTVSLTVTDATHGSRTLTRMNYIVTDPAAAPTFTVDRTCGASPLLVNFMDTTPGATAWAWDFNGDGMPDSTVQNPAWVFLPGVHSVTLTVTVACHQSSVTRNNLIEVFPGTANFRGAEILEYQFNEVRGSDVFNAASTTAAATTGSVQTASMPATNWQTDPGRTGFRGAAGGALANSGLATDTNLVSTGYPMNINGSMTVSWWHRMASPPGTSLAYSWGGAGAAVRCFTGGVAGNGLYYRGSTIGDVITQTMDVQANAGTWEHIALVIDDNAGQAHWYFNGVLDGTTNFTPGTHSATNTEFHVGWHTSTTSTFTRYYDMDDFRLYCRALSPMEILALATAPENPAASLYGQDCPGPGGTPQMGASGAPALGNGLNVFVSAAEANRVAALVMGFNPVAPGIPFDLSPFLGAGCQLEVDWLSAFFHVTTAGGDATQMINVPNNTVFAGSHLYGQWLILGTQGAATKAIDLNVEG